ncbi:hypothetical protein [Aequorivita antarctica]|uniref:GIY-YIG domain-containing protein n=1 Tax=Aequorivita antarctica TaxID=153266 RepID=A0A5C6Z1N0_9FLAO|nr:hypothetical protein [Aequorivita antarctica]TXD73906.1 hypothetical protein ESU54_05400 [Aequorivita antarctica]SRX73375.1 hypothetical protein AEQU3_00811 [Aequorivita antarctica]
MKDFNWSEWYEFPNPADNDILIAPYGKGVYQLKNKATNEFILFGCGNNVAYRMSSLLPKPYGQGTRNNEEKRKYVLNNIENIIYRTIALNDSAEMKRIEQEVKLSQNYIHKF